MLIYMDYSMMNNKITHKITHKKAFAFSITMWIIASLLFATVVILRFAKDEVGLSRGLNSKLETDLMATTLLESLKFYVPTADYTSTSLKNELLSDTKYPLPSEIIVDGREYNVTKEMTLSLKDTSGLLNVTYGSSSFMAKALTSPKEEALSSRLKNSLDDWRDEDNIPKINGAEQSSYRSLDKKVKVRNNHAIQDTHELKLIYGFDKIDFKRIESNLYYGKGSTMNLLLIENSGYLANLLGTDEAFIEDTLAVRESDPKSFMQIIGKLPSYNDDYMGFWLSKQFMVTIVARKGVARTIIKATITFKQIHDRPYMTLSYVSY